MKKKSPDQTELPPAEEEPLQDESKNPSSLDPSELARVLLEAEPRPVEASTIAIPVKHLDQTQTEGMPPSPATGSQTEALPVLASPQSVPAMAQPAPVAGGALKRWLGLAACLLLLAGLAIYWAMRPGTPGDVNTEAPLEETNRPASEPVPPELRPYMDQAAKGDAKAMHMIALMYWNGLNVQQDRAKGLAWYRKSAAAGDKGAQKELSVIEGK